VIESRAEDIKVVATASNGHEAVDKVAEFSPDVALLDVRMPEMDGVEAAKQIHQEYPDVSIVMLTTFDDDEYVRDALSYGAVGYLLKDIPPKKLIASIRAVKEGSVMMAPSIAKKLIRQVSVEPAKSPEEEKEEKPQWLKDLSRRELEVLKLLAEGYDNRQISEQLCIAEQTVKNHVSEIYSKLGTHSRIKTMKMVQKIQYKDYLD
jgi:DNA-binding NarL/FixJ family response regulator